MFDRYLLAFTLALASGCELPAAEMTSQSDDLRSCGFSDIGQQVLDAVQASNPDRTTVSLSSVGSIGNRAEPALIDGQQMFTRLADLIAAAREEVLIETWGWEAGSNASVELLDGMVRLQTRLAAEDRRGRPVTVRIIVDHRQTDGRSQAWVGPLLKALAKRQLDPQLVTVELASREHLGRDSMHQKVAIIDNTWVHLGGANVEDKHDWYRLDDQGHRGPRLPWRDTAYVVQGEIARVMRADFAFHWAQGQTWFCDGFGPSCTRKTSQLPAAPIEPEPPANTCTPMIALIQRAYENFLTPNYNGVDSAQDQGWLAALGAARRVVKIQSPNLNDDAAKHAILDTLRRGVEVRLILTKKFNDRSESLPGQGGTNDTTLDSLYATAKKELGSEAACRLLQARWHAKEDGTLIEDAPDRPGGLAHVKYLSVDDQLVIVGSGNMDTQSWNFSGEVNLAVDDADVTRKWDGQVFDPHFRRGVATGHCR